MDAAGKGVAGRALTVGIKSQNALSGLWKVGGGSLSVELWEAGSKGFLEKVLFLDSRAASVQKIRKKPTV